MASLVGTCHEVGGEISHVIESHEGIVGMSKEHFYISSLLKIFP